MRQVNYYKYGDAEVLKVVETSQPKLKGDDKILVKVLYSSLNAIDWKNRKGHFRLVSGFIKPRTKQGFDIVGIIVAKSENVTGYEINEKVIGQLGNLTGGALSDYVLLSTKQVVKAPSNIPNEQLGGLAMAGTTAWQALFENASLKAGDKVLINGGSSGVGHLAIQIAKAYGAQVTSVSSTKNIDFCKKLGADYTIDYTQEDFTTLDAKFDIIFDVVSNSSFKKVKKILKPKGIYIGTTPTPRLLIESLLTKQAKFVSVRPNKKALSDLSRLLEKGWLNVQIDQIYVLEEIVDAHKYMELSRARGKVIIKVYRL